MSFLNNFYQTVHCRLGYIVMPQVYSVVEDLGPGDFNINPSHQSVKNVAE